MTEWSFIEWSKNLVVHKQTIYKKLMWLIGPKLPRILSFIINMHSYRSLYLACELTSIFDGDCNARLMKEWLKWINTQAWKLKYIKSLPKIVLFSFASVWKDEMEESEAEKVWCDSDKKTGD